MSIQAVAAVLDTDVGEVAAKMLLVCIANAHNSSTGYCCPSIERLALESSMGRSTVKRWLHWLQRHRFLTIEERLDTTGRQQSHTYRLTLTEGSKLDPSPQDVVGPDLDPRGSAGEPDEGSTVEPPLKKPEEQPESPQPPKGGHSFASIWEKWPEANRGNRQNAEGAFAKLLGEDRDSAFNAVELTLKALNLRKERLPALVAYFRNRVFVEFDGAPDVDFDGHFVVKPGMPEWNEWMGHLRKQYGEHGVQSAVKRGSFLPKTRWPPGFVPGAAK